MLRDELRQCNVEAIETLIGLLKFGTRCRSVRERLSQEFFQGIQTRLDKSVSLDADAAPSDYWILVGVVLERAQIVHRKVLFDPSTAPDIPVNIGMLADHRSTGMLFDDGSFPGGMMIHGVIKASLVNPPNMCFVDIQVSMFRTC